MPQVPNVQRNYRANALRKSQAEKMPRSEDWEQMHEVLEET